MIEVHAYSTPNSLKVSIALEEMGLEHRLLPVNLREGAQRSESFKLLNPNGKVPVLVDGSASAEADVVLSESAAILVYLAEKTDQFLPKETYTRGKVFEQLFFHASAVSPAYLQAFLIGMQASPDPETKNKVNAEVNRVLGVLDHVLTSHRYVAGEAYTIADMAHFGWIWRTQATGASLQDFPAVSKWYDELLARTAVASAIDKTIALSR
jgi:glutathione S-transferase